LKGRAIASAGFIACCQWELLTLKPPRSSLFTVGKCCSRIKG